MPYITINLKQSEHQLTLEDIWFGLDEKYLNQTKDVRNTKTVFVETISDRLAQNTDFTGMIKALEEFNEKYKALIETEDKSTLYRSFKIPKRSGGLRKIDAPKDELMAALRELKTIFETKLYARYHTCAFAYVKGRCTIDAVKRHQANNSRWFLKLDFSNFFGSTTPEFLYNQLCTIFPFSEITKRPEGEHALRRALSLCFLDGGLPQGTPISPLLTNVMMIPIDHAISKAMHTHTPHIVYTRYADDLILSSDIKFDFIEVQNIVKEILKTFNAPFSIKTEKTRFGSSAGRNWNLGVMLNKDNEITIGHAKKKQFKAMLHTLMEDDKNGRIWSVEDAQVLNGLISYYTMVEKDKIEAIIKKYSDAYGKPVSEVLKRAINQ